MDDQPQPGIAAPFPTPPPFYKHFTHQNLARLDQLRKQAGIPKSSKDNDDVVDSQKSSASLDVLSLPPELRFLIPPAPPADGRYRSFGAQVNLLAPEQSLGDAGIEQLYPPTAEVRLNPQAHLVALARSLLTTFLALVGVLATQPERFEPAAADLQTIMFNIHDLINQYRPHQARESLILMMEERVERLRDEVRRIREGREKVDKVLRELREGGEALGVELVDDGDGVRDAGGKLKGVAGHDRTERQRAAWRAVAAELGAAAAD